MVATREGEGEGEGEGWTPPGKERKKRMRVFLAVRKKALRGGRRSRKSVRRCYSFMFLSSKPGELFWVGGGERGQGSKHTSDIIIIIIIIKPVLVSVWTQCLNSNRTNQNQTNTKQSDSMRQLQGRSQRPISDEKEPNQSGRARMRGVSVRSQGTGCRCWYVQ